VPAVATIHPLLEPYRIGIILDWLRKSRRTSVAYTDPEVAWAGITENEAKATGINYGKGVFPWAASGRSLSLGRDEG